MHEFCVLYVSSGNYPRRVAVATFGISRYFLHLASGWWLCLLIVPILPFTTPNRTPPFHVSTTVRSCFCQRMLKVPCIFASQPSEAPNPQTGEVSAASLDFLVSNIELVKMGHVDRLESHKVVRNTPPFKVRLNMIKWILLIQALVNVTCSPFRQLNSPQVYLKLTSIISHHLSEALITVVFFSNMQHFLSNIFWFQCVSFIFKSPKRFGSKSVVHQHPHHPPHHQHHQHHMT